MPIHPFVCQTCKHEWEELRSHKDPMPYCPDCKSPDVQRTIGNTTFRLVGASWAASGYGITNRSRGKT